MRRTTRGTIARGDRRTTHGTSLLLNPGNDQPLAGHHAAVAGQRHRAGIGDLSLDEAGVLHLAPLLESGLGRPGAERGDGYARTAELLGERLREGKHVRLAGVIDGHQRTRLEGGSRGEVEDAASAGF